MSLISSAGEVNDLAAKEPNTGGVYFVTAFSGLLAPYWDPGAAGLLIGASLQIIMLPALGFTVLFRDIPIHQSVSSCPRDT